MLGDIRRHLGVRPAVGRDAGLLLDELVRPVAGFAALAVHQGVGKAAHMARGHPYLRIHQNGAVQPHVIGGLLHKAAPPGGFHIVFKQHAQQAVIPVVGESAVYLRTGVDITSGFTEIDDLIHGFVGVVHQVYPSLIRDSSILMRLSMEVKARRQSSRRRPRLSLPATVFFRQPTARPPVCHIRRIKGIFFMHPPHA
jgi:hypothetical protein